MDVELTDRRSQVRWCWGPLDGCRDIERKWQETQILRGSSRHVVGVSHLVGVWSCLDGLHAVERSMRYTRQISTLWKDDIV